MNMHTSIATPRGADGLNTLAREEGWPILCDASCRFTNSKLTAVAKIWHDKAAGQSIPFRKDMTARLMQPFMPMLSFYERVGEAGERRYRARLTGTAIVEITTEMSGRFLDEIIAPDYLPRWNAIGDAVLEQGSPVRVLSRCDSFNKSYIVGEFFCAALRAEDGTVSRILTAASFDSVQPWAEVEAAERARLGLQRDSI